MVYFTEGVLITIILSLRRYYTQGTDQSLENAWTAMAQGQAYRKTLPGQIDRVRDLIANVDQEAAVSLQYHLRDLEKLRREYFPNITRQLLELKEQQSSKNFTLDEATKKGLPTRIGEAAAGYDINSFYSHFFSNPGIDGRVRGRPLEPTDHDSLLKIIKA